MHSFIDRPITFSQLPQKTQQFITKHFDDVEFISATVGDDYEVYLANGTKAEFNLRGEWTEIKCINGIPASIIPDNIYKYVNDKFAKNFIIKIDRDRRGYEIELNNDIELKFDKYGNLLDIDY